MGQVARLSSLVLQPQVSAPTFGAQHCLEASVQDKNGNALHGLRVDFTVSGANTTSGSVFSGADGLERFCYTGMTQGEDQVTASSSSLSVTALVAWQASNGIQTADTGPDLQITEGVAFTLDASGSLDLENNVLA